MNFYVHNSYVLYILPRSCASGTNSTLSELATIWQLLDLRQLLTTPLSTSEAGHGHLLLIMLNT